MLWRTLTGVFMAAALAAEASARQAPPPSEPPLKAPPTPSPSALPKLQPGDTARPEDVASIDSIVKTFYDAISGPAGAPRQWARDRSLYVPGLKFVVVGVKEGGS